MAMLCAECGSEMYLDDKDYNFKGNYDNYWNCPNCTACCIEYVRYNKAYKVVWHSENNNNVKDWTEYKN